MNILTQKLRFFGALSPLKISIKKRYKKTRTDEMVQIEVCLIHIKVYNSILIREEKAKKLKKNIFTFLQISQKRTGNEIKRNVLASDSFGHKTSARLKSSWLNPFGAGAGFKIVVPAAKYRLAKSYKP